MDEGSLSDTQRTMVLPLLQETNIRGKPYITVSAKGIVNGLSRYPNDGADFGPDTTLGATAPGQYGSPYTETGGIMEAKASLPKLYNPSSTRYVPSGLILLHFSDAMIKISTPIILYDDEFVEITASDGFTYTTFGVGISLTNYSGYITNTTSTSIIQILKNPTNNTGNGTIKLSNLTLVNTYSASTNTFPVLYCGPNTYSVTYSANTATDPMFGSLFLDKMIVDDNNGNQPLVYLATPGFEQLVDIGDIFLSGNSGNYNMMTVAASHIKGGYWYILSTGAVAAPTVNETGFMLSVSVGQDCHIGIYHFNFNGNGVLWTTGLGGQTGAMAMFDIIRDEMQTIYNNGGLDQYTGHTTMGTQTGIIIGYYSGSSTSVPLGMSILDPPSNYIVIREYPQQRSATTNNIFQTPSLSANPPVSGTAYQNTNAYGIRLKIPVTYSPTSSAAATLTTGISQTSTVTTSTKVSIPAGVTAGEILTYEMDVPAGWYYELVVTNATIGTVEVQAA